jgi:hypothetical protein
MPCEDYEVLADDKESKLVSRLKTNPGEGAQAGG